MEYQQGLALRIRVGMGFVGIIMYLFGPAALVIALNNRNDEHFMILTLSMQSAKTLG